MRAFFLIPGDLNRKTGGYGYDRRVLAGARRHGVALQPIALPDGFPCPDEVVRRDTIAILKALEPHHPLVIDGLAFGAFDEAMLETLKGPVIALVHHPLAYENGISADLAAKLKASERLALQHAAAIVVTSAPTRKLLIDDYHVPDDKIIVAIPGTDPAPLAQGSGRADPVFLGVGSLTPRKAWSVLIEALAQNRDDGWTAKIIGEGPERASLLALIKAHDLAGRIVLEGEVDETGLAAAYNEADCFVMPSLYEGFGMALTEALARGLPCLASDGVVAIQHLPPSAVITAPAGDVDGMAKAIRHLLDPAHRAEAAAQAQKAALSLPRWDDTARIIADVIRSVRA